MKYFWLFVALILAIFISFVLFLIMNNLITYPVKHIVDEHKKNMQIYIYNDTKTPEEKHEPDTKITNAKALEFTQEKITFNSPKINLNLFSNKSININLPNINTIKNIKIQHDIAFIDEKMAIKKAKPRYPTKAKRQGLSGEVRCEFKIAPNGEVYDIIITSSKPKGVFDHVSLQALKLWRFSPFSSEEKYKISSTIFRFRIE